MELNLLHWRSACGWMGLNPQACRVLSMKFIRANCRVQFSPADVDFVVNVLGSSSSEMDCVRSLLTDAPTRDQMLDDPRLADALVNGPGCLRVSTRMYFYVLVRRALLDAGVADARVADYVAEMLAEFAEQRHLRCTVPGQDKPLEYFVDLLAALARADERSAFLLRAHIGNYALFLTGLFPDRLRYRAEQRGAPSLDYYEQMGRSGFASASAHRLARQVELSSVYGELAESFPQARRALNDVAGRVFTLGDRDKAVEALLAQVDRGLLN
jgi:hypothetical protein